MASPAMLRVPEAMQQATSLGHLPALHPLAQNSLLKLADLSTYLHSSPALPENPSTLPPLLLLFISHDFRNDSYTPSPLLSAAEVS
jgi:hypothetical protein